VTWELVDGPEGEPRLRVDWRETGVPVLTVVPDSASGDEMTAPRRRGYGRELIERALPYQLKAETTYELTPEGVHCTITMPVSSTLGEGGETAKEESDG
jgi:two-component sensor histidine kinase